MQEYFYNLILPFLMAELLKHGTSTVNRILATLKHMVNKGVQWNTLSQMRLDNFIFVYLGLIRTLLRC